MPTRAGGHPLMPAVSFHTAACMYFVFNTPLQCEQTSTSIWCSHLMHTCCTLDGGPPVAGKKPVSSGPRIRSRIEDAQQDRPATVIDPWQDRVFEKRALRFVVRRRYEELDKGRFVSRNQAGKETLYPLSTVISRDEYFFIRGSSPLYPSLATTDRTFRIPEKSPEPGMRRLFSPHPPRVDLKNP